MTLRKSFYVASCLCFSAWMSVGPAAAAVHARTGIQRTFSKKPMRRMSLRCLQGEANVNKRWNIGSSTPLHKAAKYSKDPDVIITLLKAGAEINATTDRNNPLESKSQKRRKRRDAPTLCSGIQQKSRDRSNPCRGRSQRERAGFLRRNSPALCSGRQRKPGGHNGSSGKRGRP